MKNELTVLRLTVHRYRRTYVTHAVFTVALIGLAQVMASKLVPAIAIPLAILYMLSLLWSVTTFANPDADLAGDAPALPAFLLRLPVSTRALALPPLLSASLWPVLAWVALACGFLRPIGLAVQIAWPAALLAAIGPTIMAIQWAPLRSGKIRLALSLTLPILLVGFGLWNGANPGGWTMVTAVCLAVTATSIGTAWWGLAVSRTSMSGRADRVPGESKVSKALARVPSRPARVRPPFTSPLAAQRWLEWQRQGRILPLITTFSLGTLSIPLLWERTLRYEDWTTMIYPNAWVGSIAPTLFWIPILFASVIGLGARRNDTKNPEGGYDLFFATRPADASTLIRAKVQAGILSALATWGVVLSFGFFWYLFPATQAGRVAPYLLLLLGAMSPAYYLFCGLALIGLVALTWRNQTVGMVADFIPTRYAKRVYGATMVILGTCAYVVCNIYSYQWTRPGQQGVPEGLMLAAFIAKLLAARFIARRIIALRPSSRAEVRRHFTTWAIGSFAATSLIIGLLTISTDFIQSAIFTLPIVLLAGPLLMPLARPLATRLALEIGRHG